MFPAYNFLEIFRVTNIHLDLLHETPFVIIRNKLVLVLWSLFTKPSIMYGFMGLTPATAAEDILSTVADSLMLIGLDGKIIHANRKVHDLLGYTEEELKGRDIVSILSGIEMSAIVESGGVYSNETTFLTKSGERIPMLLSHLQ